VKGLTTEEQIELLALLQERERIAEQNKFARMFPDSGALSRELYPKHLEHFAAGMIHNERLFMAANRVGKTEAGAYETTLHLTGRYPHWWEGRTFERPIDGWAVGQTSKTTRDVLQLSMLGTTQKLGTGMLPADAIVNTTPKAGIPEAVESVYVRHVSGGQSSVTFKSYDQGVESFYGSKRDLVWLDEECEKTIYAECLLRTMATVPGERNGVLILTFTPLYGMTELVRDFIVNEEAA
jgi:phage terminase large subunit-like protein